jgi:hypothetical protein
VTAARQLTMVIPGLFGPAESKRPPEIWRDLSLPALDIMLSRARRESSEGKGLERTLFALFRLSGGDGVDLPIAAVTRQWEAGDAGGYWWLRADPVHLRADRDRIVMLGNRVLDIAVEECNDIAAELNQHFAGEGWKLEAPNVRRWYLRLDKDPQINTDGLPEVIGQDIVDHMPRGPAAAYWRSVMNEVQMVLHSSRVNREREARGALPVNSLWFWGGGELPSPPAVAWSQLWGNDALSKSLASLARVPASSQPAEAEEWLEDGTPGEHLLIWDGLQEKIRFGEVEAWREFLRALHDDWLKPLLTALKQRRLAAVHLYPTDGSSFRLTGRDARRWWVGRRSLDQWL